MLNIKSLKLIALTAALLLSFTANSLLAASMDNDPPTVSIVTPTYKQVFLQPTAVLFSANAYDDGSISRVEFYIGRELIGVDTSYPYRAVKYLTTAGTHTILVKAIDNDGNIAVTTSEIELRNKYEVAPQE